MDKITNQQVSSFAFPEASIRPDVQTLDPATAGYPKFVLVTFNDLEIGAGMVSEDNLPLNGAPLEAMGLAAGTTHDGLRLILAQTWDASTKTARVIRIPVSSITKMVELAAIPKP